MSIANAPGESDTLRVDNADECLILTTMEMA